MYQPAGPIHQLQTDAQRPDRTSPALGIQRLRGFHTDHSTYYNQLLLRLSAAATDRFAQRFLRGYILRVLLAENGQRLPLALHCCADLYSAEKRLANDSRQVVKSHSLQTRFRY